MRILHYQYSLAPEIGGPARAVIDLSAALARRGHSVSIATGDPGEAPPDWVVKPGAATTPGTPAVHLFPLPSGPIGLFPRATLNQFKGLIERHDVLHLHGAWGPWNVQLGAAARKLGKPYFISIRGMLDDWCMQQSRPRKMIFLALAGRRWMERAKAVHLTAQFEFEQARKYFPRGNGVVIPNLLDLRPFEKLPGPERARAKFPMLNSGKPTLLFLSRIHVKKGIETLLRAARLLHDQGQPCNVIIAGSGEPEYVDSLKRLSTELKLDGIAHFVGLVTGDDKLSLYQASDLFVLPTSQENFGFVFVEALACGTPVVTTKGVDIWPELEKGGGSVITDATPEATAGACAGLLSNVAALKPMGEKGRARVFDWLDPNKVLAQFEAMYGAA